MGHNPIIKPKAGESVQAYYATGSSLPYWPRVPLAFAHINKLMIIAKEEEPHTRQPTSKQGKLE